LAQVQVFLRTERATHSLVYVRIGSAKNTPQMGEKPQKKWKLFRELSLMSDSEFLYCPRAQFEHLIFHHRPSGSSPSGFGKLWKRSFKNYSA
jgi:hypothetical protein